MSTHTLLSIQQYATKHKMSTFAVIKRVNAKELKMIKKNVDGKEQEFIVDESTPPPHPSSNVLPSNTQEHSPIDYEVEFHKLLAKYIELHEKYTQILEEKTTKE
ncbi:hypothetical protein [Sulfurospirillum barnesii]|uniref:Uncharacterized protein n=1 Tax=Sulfurospirillum barnesii (strain ATCC 700032 / DSM 10660 / SES-3) TaxID=760154 RepID=I3XXH6_SULBS|nr:hypothetical protein [Sulfurospirillum barnesii]AFL68650.1 hypothetical protein Sulba_1361 [Sulfurospirillum barnesii SES-3]